MKHPGQGERLVAAAIVVGIFFGLGGCTSLQTTDTLQQSVVAKAQEKQQQAPAPAAAPAMLVSFPYIPAPNSIDLCGEPVPLHRQDVYERFDKEFTLVVYNNTQSIFGSKEWSAIFRQSRNGFHYNLPDDLKFVAIAESDLLPNACSPKGAAGPWQFMPSTGSAYGLDQRGW